MESKTSAPRLPPPRHFPWRAFLGSLFSRLDIDNVTGLSAQVSYYFSLALFPFLIVLGAVVGILPFTHSWQAILAWITHYLPTDIQSTVFETVASLTKNRKEFLSLGLLGSLWAASGGITTLMSALNTVYGVTETRSYWKRLILSILLLFVLALLLVSTFGLLSVGHRFVEKIVLKSASENHVVAIAARITRWSLSIAVSVFCISFLDHVLPNTKRPWHWISHGTAVVVVTWIVTTLGFNFYILHFASYQRTYGILAGFFVLMMWIYIMSLIGLVGAEIDSELRKVSQ
jgi:membrane protein